MKGHRCDHEARPFHPNNVRQCWAQGAYSDDEGARWYCRRHALKRGWRVCLGGKGHSLVPADQGSDYCTDCLKADNP